MSRIAFSSPLASRTIVSPARQTSSPSTFCTSSGRFVSLTSPGRVRISSEHEGLITHLPCSRPAAIACQPFTRSLNAGSGDGSRAAPRISLARRNPSSRSVATVFSPWRLAKASGERYTFSILSSPFTSAISIPRVIGSVLEYSLSR